ncbi:V-Set And Transmembrane Domain-Containing Protein 2A [Manis pentadactyla]|nr:V-Set And Transmembrane Domain-Containing Protein 2A [Manis pentadactyla]
MKSTNFWKLEWFSRNVSSEAVEGGKAEISKLLLYDEIQCQQLFVEWCILRSPSELKGGSECHVRILLTSKQKAGRLARNCVGKPPSDL